VGVTKVKKKTRIILSRKEGLINNQIILLYFYVASDLVFYVQKLDSTFGI
jgi:hypothetical protein